MTSRADQARAVLAAAEIAAASTVSASTVSASTVSASTVSATPPQGNGRPGGADPDADPYAVARAIALRQLSMAPRSRAELERKLHRKGCLDDVATAVLDRLAEVGLVDDVAYAQMLVRSKQATRGLARGAMSAELRGKGVDADTAHDALAVVDDADERARAEALVTKRLRAMHGLAPDVQARRLAGMLARKGYPTAIALAVVRDAIANAPEHQRD